MSYPNPDTYRQTEPSAIDPLSAELVALSRWIDESPANAARDAEARTWGRVSKVAEECGEVVSEMIAWTGQNPRKVAYPDASKVIKELADVAVTALGAIEHLTGNQGRAMDLLIQHLHSVVVRARL